MKNKPNWNLAGCELYKNGVQLGHKSIPLSRARFWHPLMAEYLVGIRYGMGILDTHQTRKSILKAFYVLALILQKKGHVLVVNTNPEFSKIHENFHHFLKTTPNVSFCFYKWSGGTLTNWKQISRSILTFAKFSERCGAFLTKNNIEFPRYKKIKRCFQGFLTQRHQKIFLSFSEKPDIVFLFNPNENRNIIAEAAILHIPVIAFVESNTDCTGISYPIPTNTYSVDLVYYCLKKIAKFSDSTFTN